MGYSVVYLTMKRMYAQLVVANTHQAGHIAHIYWRLPQGTSAAAQPHRVNG